MENKKITWLLALTILAAAILAVIIDRQIRNAVKRNIVEREVIVRDTVTVEKHDTFVLTKLKPTVEYKYKTVTDTLETVEHDTVYVNLPLIVKEYEGDTLSDDGTKVTYKATLSGYKMNLDSLRFSFDRKDSVIYETITKYRKQRGFKVMPYVGVGYNPFKRRIEPSFGVGVGYCF